MADLTFSVEGQAETATRLAVQARQFSIVVDEPPVLGGNDIGANPVEYLLAGYAGCVNVVAHLVARELGIKLDKLTVKVDGNLNPERFLGKSDNERAGFKQINLILQPETQATPEQLIQWVREIENRCPINDNLQNSTPVSLTISGS